MQDERKTKAQLIEELVRLREERAALQAPAGSAKGHELGELRDDRLYRALIETLPDAVFLVDTRGRLVMASPAAARLLGYDETEELYGDGFAVLDLLAPEERESAVAAMLRMTSAGRPGMSEWTVLRKDGSRLPTEVTSSLLRDESGAPLAFIVVVRDISERRHDRAELAERAAELTRANSELEKLHHTKDEFIATVSHELRTPLVTGMGYIELLLEGLLGPVTHDMTEKLGVALKNLKRLSRLIDSILDFQRLARRDFTESPKFSVFDPAELLREAAAELVVRSGRSLSTVRAEIPDALPAVFADRDMLRRAVANLLDNAAGHAGPEARITLRAEAEAHGVRIAVVDDGVGMTAEFREKALEPFARADSASAGTGLGLAIVREILKSHGSPVFLESEIGAGTTVRFTLPAASAEVDTRDGFEAPPAEPAAGAGAQVLVVDDDTDMLDLVLLALTQRGYCVHLAASAERALSLLERKAVDLILLDMSLPGMDGDELCRRLKSRAATAEIPVLMFTARTETSARNRATAAGCDGYLVKPVALNELLGSIREVLTG